MVVSVFIVLAVGVTLEAGTRYELISPSEINFYNRRGDVRRARHPVMPTPADAAGNTGQKPKEFQEKWRYE